jgi:hypothetical protein
MAKTNQCIGRKAGGASQKVLSSGDTPRLKKIIIVVGVGRSGTSLLQSMLASHPEVAFLPETSFFRRFVVNGKLTHMLRTKGWVGIEQFLGQDQSFSRVGLTPDVIGSCAIDRDHITDGTLYATLLDRYGELSGKSWVGDKDPRLIEFLDLLHSVLPDAQIVHIVRDPRDVLVSKKRATWSKDRNPYIHIFANRVQLKLGRSIGKRLFKDQFHEVVYEKLIANPENELKRLGDNIGIGFHHAMLEYGTAARRLVTEHEMQWKKETLGPLLRHNSGKWREGLSACEIALTELICREHFMVGGYEKSNAFAGLPVMEKVKVLLLAGGIWIAGPIYVVYRKWTQWKSRKYA